MSNKIKTDYVLITPVHNEEELLEMVFEAVVHQTIPPVHWLIVNDDSHDRSAEIIENYKARYPYIEHYQIEREEIHSYYSRRTQVMLKGYARICSRTFTYWGSLDADLTMEPDYYENILNEFARNPRLGIASGVYWNKVKGKLEKVVRDNISTPGGLQMFRRKCYEQFGGYRPLQFGGDDSLADVMARMNGWETHSFPEYAVIHHRPVGTRGGTSLFKARYRQGRAEYSLGTHPVFMMAKSLRRMFLEKPLILGSMARCLGYCSGYTNNHQQESPPEAIKFFRREQLGRLFGRRLTAIAVRGEEGSTQIE